MRLRDIIIFFVCLVVAIALFITAGTQLDFINSQRQKMKLIINEPLENAPPSLAFATVAMGAFRGLLVDILWLRADNLKDKGEFFDAKQIAEWIVALQPRFGMVWQFHAWNMAYNISVAIPATQPQERWRWVKNGYELLRDKGIPLNPKDMVLYEEMANIFQHKMGFVSDDAHKYYKLQLALAMEPLLGPADNEYFKALAEAPTEMSQIAQDADIASLINALKSADKTFEDDKEFVNNYLSLRQNPAKFKPDAFNVIDNFRGTKALEKFDVFAKAYNLRNTWKLDPVVMQQLNQTYGPIDWNDPNKHLPLEWRHPCTHAIYWALKGLEVAGKDEYSQAEIMTDRMVNGSLQALFSYGKIFIYDIPVQTDPNSQTTEQKTRKELFLRPDLRMLEPCSRSELKRIEKYEYLKDFRKGTLKSLKDGHRNMLQNAVVAFYQAGHIKQAQRLYNQVSKLYPDERFNMPLVKFVHNRLREEFQNLGLHDASEQIQMMLMEAYFRYAMRDDDEAFGLEKMAKEIHDYYQSTYSDENRIDLPDFKLLRYFALMDFLTDEQYPLIIRRNLMGRIRVERPELAEQLKQENEKLLKEYEKLRKE